MVFSLLLTDHSTKSPAATLYLQCLGNWLQSPKHGPLCLYQPWLLQVCPPEQGQEGWRIGRRGSPGYLLLRGLAEAGFVGC